MQKPECISAFRLSVSDERLARESLPSAVVGLLEQRVGGRGKLILLAALANRAKKMKLFAKPPDYLPDLNFKKAKAEASGEQKTSL